MVIPSPDPRWRRSRRTALVLSLLAFCALAAGTAIAWNYRAVHANSLEETRRMLLQSADDLAIAGAIVARHRHAREAIADLVAKAAGGLGAADAREALEHLRAQLARIPPGKEGK